MIRRPWFYRTTTNMEWNLVVDHREHKLLPLLTIPHSSRALDVADLEINQGSKRICLIERKTYPDFFQSVRDGRYREQKTRLLHSESLHKMYIFEGSNKAEGRQDFPANYLDHLVLRLLLKDDIKVLFTRSVSETASVITLLFEKLQKQPELSQRREERAQTTTSYVSLVHASKKQNLTPQVCYLLQLKQIPSVSDAIAAIIAQEYPTLQNLCHRLTQKQGLRELEDLKLSNKRRIGPSVALKIATYLQCSSSPSSSVPEETDPSPSSSSSIVTSKESVSS